MGLPIQKAPKHRCKLSDGTEVTFRPFLVKEQKYLLVARESESPTEIIGAIKNLIHAVTEGTVDADKLPIFDVEYLFLQIRAKSVGESVDVRLFCQNIDCGSNSETKVDLSKVKVKFPERKVDNKVELTETLGVTLRHPTAKKIAEADSNEDDQDKLIQLLAIGLETIYDEETVYNADEISDSDLIEFVESLTMPQVEKLQAFFENTPALQEDIDWTCSSCGMEQTTTVKGLQNFF
tara:strand:+ start:227 stop:934 length:708 start_codon:yes stop_codon:yes gene_type:complete